MILLKIFIARRFHFIFWMRHDNVILWPFRASSVICRGRFSRLAIPLFGRHYNFCCARKRMRVCYASERVSFRQNPRNLSCPFLFRVYLSSNGMESIRGRMCTRVLWNTMSSAYVVDIDGDTAIISLFVFFLPLTHSARTHTSAARCVYDCDRWWTCYAQCYIGRWTRGCVRSFRRQ